MAEKLQKADDRTSETQANPAEVFETKLGSYVTGRVRALATGHHSYVEVGSYWKVLVPQEQSGHTADTGTTRQEAPKLKGLIRVVGFTKKQRTHGSKMSKTPRATTVGTGDVLDDVMIVFLWLYTSSKEDLQYISDNSIMSGGLPVTEVLPKLTGRASMEQSGTSPSLSAIRKPLVQVDVRPSGEEETGMEYLLEDQNEVLISTDVETRKLSDVTLVQEVSTLCQAVCGPVCVVQCMLYEGGVVAY